MLVSAAVLAGVVVPSPSFAEYFGPVSRIPAVDGHCIKQTSKSSSGPGRVCLVSSPAVVRPVVVVDDHPVVDDVVVVLVLLVDLVAPLAVSSN